jgi:hypothetical protein
MSLPYSDPSNPALPSPLFSDLTAVRGDHLRANNSAIFADLDALDARNPALVPLSGGSFKTSALANAVTYNGRSTFMCTAGVTDTPYSGVWSISGIWNPADSAGRFIAMLDTTLETWEIKYSGGAWGAWTKHTDSNGNQYANAFVDAFTTTATAGGTLTLTVASAPNQFFTGSSNHTVALPVASTLQQGFAFYITNTSTGTITVNSSGGNLVASVSPLTTRQFLCILASGTDAASWFVSYDAVPVGHEMDWSGLTAPTNYIPRDGASLLRSSYPALFAVLCGITISISNITIGSAAVFTSNSHGLSTFQCVSFEGTTPGGVSAGANYYITVVDPNTFKISDTMAHAIALSYVTTTGSYSNVILRKSSWGTADITHFNVPDERGIESVGAGTQGTAPGWLGSLANHIGIVGYYTEDQSFAHWHDSWTHSPVSGSAYYLQDNGNGPDTLAVSSLCTVKQIRDMSSDGVHGTPRTGYITKSARVGKLKIIKYQ